MSHERANTPNPIAERNDAFRQQLRDWYITAGAQALPDQADLLSAIQHYDRFTKDTDPYGEHDYGSFVWRGERTLWKIDYYDQQLQYWCDPLSEECRRIGTIMLGSEY